MSYKHEMRSEDVEVYFSRKYNVEKYKDGHNALKITNPKNNKTVIIEMYLIERSPFSPVELTYLNKNNSLTAMDIELELMKEH